MKYIDYSTRSVMYILNQNFQSNSSKSQIRPRNLKNWRLRKMMKSKNVDGDQIESCLLGLDQLLTNAIGFVSLFIIFTSKPKL